MHLKPVGTVLRAAFGFVEVLEIIDHEADQDRDEDEAAEERQQGPPPADR